MSAKRSVVRASLLLACSFAFLLLLLLGVGHADSSPELEPPAENGPAGIITETLSFVPLASSSLFAPQLQPIDNADQDNRYSVTWTDPEVITGTQYSLQEADNPGFAAPTEVYLGIGMSWSVPDPGKTPGTYHYRVRSILPTGVKSQWSVVQAVTIYPLHVGLDVLWEGDGLIRIDISADVGVHTQRQLTGMVDPDTIRSDNMQWYDPNPLAWDSSDWESHYNVHSGELVWSSSPSDPAWKWGANRLLPYNITLVSGQEAVINSQVFLVTGPFQGTTPFGASVDFYRLVNRDTFLMWDDGGDWQQFVNAGEAVLEYDAGGTRLLLKSDVLRHFYFDGQLTAYTVQYILYLTGANSFPTGQPGPMSSSSAPAMVDDAIGDGEAVDAPAPYPTELWPSLGPVP